MTPEQRLRVEEALDLAPHFALATLREDGYPQVTTVNFARDGLTLYFATGRGSRKLRNLAGCARVALSLQRDYLEWPDVLGLSVVGVAEVLADDGAEALQARALLAARFREPWNSPSPDDPATTVYVRVTPLEIVLLDYAKGYGHRETVLP